MEQGKTVLELEHACLKEKIDLIFVRDSSTRGQQPLFNHLQLHDDNDACPLLHLY